AGFEPATPSSRTRCATRLRYTPKARLIAAQYPPRKLPMRVSARPLQASLTAQIVQEPHAVLGLLEAFGLLGQLVTADPAVVERDLLRGCNELALSALQHADEFGGLEQRIVGSGVEPCIAAAKPLDRKLTLPHVEIVQISD